MSFAQYSLGVGMLMGLLVGLVFGYAFAVTRYLGWSDRRRREYLRLPPQR